MPPVQVRDMPEDIYEGLKERAVADGRSISKEIIYIVQEYLKHDGAVAREPFIIEAESYENPFGRYEYAHVQLKDGWEALRKRIEANPMPEITGELADTAAMINKMRGER